MKIELIYFDGCPNVADVRATLTKALLEFQCPAKWIEWNQKSKDCPTNYMQYGSPTVLIDGMDVAPTKIHPQGNCCRIYTSDEKKLSGAPTLQVLITAMATSSNQPNDNGKMSGRPKWIVFLAAIPSIFIALLPKLTCPMCWPAYTALLASLGINFANYTPYLPVTIMSLLIISLISFGYKAKNRRGYNPLCLGIVASAGIILGQFVWSSKIIFFSGSTLLIIAAIWNAWPNRKAG